MSAIKEAARQQASNRMAEKFNLPTPAPAGARVYIVSPAADAPGHYVDLFLNAIGYEAATS